MNASVVTRAGGKVGVTVATAKGVGIVPASGALPLGAGVLAAGAVLGAGALPASGASAGVGKSAGAVVLVGAGVLVVAAATPLPESAPTSDAEDESDGAGQAFPPFGAAASLHAAGIPVKRISIQAGLRIGRVMGLFGATRMPCLPVVVFVVPCANDALRLLLWARRPMIKPITLIPVGSRGLVSHGAHLRASAPR